MKIIDSHTHLMVEPFQYLPGLPVSEFLDLMDKAEVNISVIFTIVGLIRDFSQHNDELAKVVRAYPTRLVGLGSVNPWYGDEALAEIHRCFAELNLSGLKLHPWFTGFLVNSELMNPICELAAKFDKPIFLHTGTLPGSAPLQVANLALRFPTVRFILGHMGLPDLWWEAVAAAVRHPNIYLETAGAHSLSIKRAVELLGAERVLFGSDSPFGGSNNVFFQLKKITLLDFSLQEQKQIFGLNAARIFDIPVDRTTNLNRSRRKE